MIIKPRDIGKRAIMTTESTAAMYQVICPEHGKQPLTETQYARALADANSPWKCPVCGFPSEWDEDSGVTSGDADDERDDAYADGEAPTEATAIKVNLIAVDGKVYDREWPHPATSWKDFSRYAKEYIGGPTELVAVLYNGQPATMIVNEVGASTDPDINPTGQLPINARATAIYWTATIKGITPVPFNPLADPMIHGPAILIEVDKRRL